jgi:hypothetical integral membrane protein (TIGR02206 family)
MVALFGPLHWSLLAATALLAWLLGYLCRSGRVSKRAVRLTFGFGLMLNEFGWWYFRYSREGLRVSNLPLQLCDVSLWATVAACIFVRPLLVEFAYFAGIAGAGMALITPDLWSPWPTYPAVYFFVTHGGIVAANIVLIYGRIASLRQGAPLRAFGVLVGFALSVGLFNAIFKTNYMYLCNKPKSATLLDAFGPWPLYLLVAFGLSFVLYALLWLPVRKSAISRSASLSESPAATTH